MRDREVLTVDVTSARKEADAIAARIRTSVAEREAVAP
jgi:hypothetical protein